LARSGLWQFSLKQPRRVVFPNPEFLFALFAQKVFLEPLLLPFHFSGINIVHVMKAMERGLRRVHGSVAELGNNMRIPELSRLTAELTWLWQTSIMAHK
jgi:hypothetical protein